MKPAFIAQPGASVTQLQQELAKVFDSLGIICVGLLIEDVEIGTSSTTVPHGLGSVPSAVFVAIGSVGVTVLHAADADATNLYLQASAPITVSLWVV